MIGAFDSPWVTRGPVIVVSRCFTSANANGGPHVRLLRRSAGRPTTTPLLSRCGVCKLSNTEWVRIISALWTTKKESVRSTGRSKASDSNSIMRDSNTDQPKTEACQGVVLALLAATLAALHSCASNSLGYSFDERCDAMRGHAHAKYTESFRVCAIIRVATLPVRQADLRATLSSLYVTEPKPMFSFVVVSSRTHNDRALLSAEASLALVIDDIRTCGIQVVSLLTHAQLRRVAQHVESLLRHYNGDGYTEAITDLALQSVEESCDYFTIADSGTYFHNHYFAHVMEPLRAGAQVVSVATAGEDFRSTKCGPQQDANFSRCILEDPTEEACLKTTGDAPSPGCARLRCSVFSRALWRNQSVTLSDSLGWGPRLRRLAAERGKGNKRQHAARNKAIEAFVREVSHPEQIFIHRLANGTRVVSFDKLLVT